MERIRNRKQDGVDMSRQTVYMPGKDTDGWSPGDIVCQLYNDEAWRTVLLPKQDFETITPWKFCSLLNDAYERGRKEALEDLRSMMGIKE